MTTLAEIEAAVDELPPEQQRELVTHLIAKLQTAEQQDEEDRLTPEQRIAVIHEWAESHKPVNHFVDDSRESIYEGRGE